MSVMSAVACLAQSATKPEPPNWFAGDAHVHRGIGCGRANEKEMLTPHELLEMMKPNDLAVISVLADIGNGEIKYAGQDRPRGRSRRMTASASGLTQDAGKALED